jgi:hypothetical protein
MPATKKILTVIAALALSAAAVYASLRRETAMEPVKPAEATKYQEDASLTSDLSVTPYGFNRDDLNVAEWRISSDVKRGVEGQEGCGVIRQRDNAYVPVAFGEGAPCEVARKAGATIVYGVGYSSTYETLGHLASAIYVFKDDGFYLVSDTPDLPDLNEFTPEQRAALDFFSETHPVDFGSPEWKTYDSLNRS